MTEHLRITSRRLVTGLLILAVFFSILADPLTTWAKSLSTPPKCSGGNITLVSGEGAISIENAFASNVTSLGCDLSGKMRVQIRGNDKGNITIQGFVDAYDQFTSESIGQFDLQIAGLTLVVKGSSFTGDTLYLTEPWIRIPDSWGGLEAPIGQTMKIDAGGLEVVTFKMPSLQSEKGFKLDLEGSLGLVSGGYQIQATGTLGLPDIGKTKDCGITVAVTIVADVFGQAVMFVHTPERGEALLPGGGRSQIARPAGNAALAPAAISMSPYYLPVPDTLPYEVFLQIQNRPAPAEAEATSLAAYGPLPAGEETLAGGAPGALPVSAPASADPMDLSTYYDSLPVLADETPASPLDVGFIVTASAACDTGIPIDGTGFELTGVEGTLSLRPESEFVRLKVTFKSSLKVADITALTADAWAMFQWDPEFALSVGGSLTVLDMFNVGEATISVSESDGFRTTVNWNSWFIKASFSIHAWTTTSSYCSTWESWCYYPYPLPPICGTACSDWGYSDKFHLTGSVSCRIGMAKGELWSGCVLPYPCHFRWCRKWFIYYPCWSWCWACIDIPPFDIWLAGAGAEFGEFTGDRWGLKGYVSFLGFTTGFYVDHTGDFDLGDVSGYRLVDSTELALARQAWLATQQGAQQGSEAVPLDETFTFLRDDRVLVNFDLPLADAYKLPLAPSDLISAVNVITQTDTIFSVKADIPLRVTMVSPNGVAITPENYGTHPGGYTVEYSQVLTYEQVSAPSYEANLNEARWRFIPASGDPDFDWVDVSLDGTLVFTDVNVQDIFTDMQGFPYVNVEPGVHALDVYGVDGALLSGVLSVITGTDTTVLTVGEQEAQLLVISDDNQPPSDFGLGKLRVVNAADNADPMDAALMGAGIGDFSILDLAYPTASDYLELPAGTYSLSLASSGFDPLPAITLTGEISSTVFGIKVASAGDVNGDGYDDVLVADNAFDNERGKVYLYHGTPAGLEAEPAWEMEGENETVGYDPGDLFGSGMASAGDVNGDGFDDVVVTAPEYDWVEGKAYLYLGSVNGLGASPAWTKTGVEYEHYYVSVAGAGDVNGDGYDDVLLGHPEIPDFDSGEAYLFYGSPAGLASEPAWSINGYYEPFNVAEFGKTLASAGDVNGDGYGDVVIGAPPGRWSGETDLGKAFLFLGSASGPSTTPDWVVEGENHWDQFGLALDGVGDINGDGYDDVLVGAPDYPAGDPPGGKIYAYLGSPAGLATWPAWTFVHTTNPDHFGNSIAGAGDVNGDGLDDFFVGAYTAASNTGWASLFYGSSSGAYWENAWYEFGNYLDDYFSISVDGAGDVNGDGYADLVAGAIANQGRAEVFYGGMGMPPMPVTIKKGDVQTFYAANVDDDAPLFLMNTTDEIYTAITETRYVVDQAITGTWSVSLEGDTAAATNLTVGAITAHDPPIVADLLVDASNLSETRVSWRLLSDYLPVTISIFANDGPITQTMVITDPLPAEETIAVFQGIEVATIPVSDELAVKNAVVSTTVDLSFLESGNYRLWVRVEDGVSPPVQGYVWTEPTLENATAVAAMNRVRVAAQGYDSVAQASGAAEIPIDHSASFGASWTATITPTINPRFVTTNSQGEPQEVVIDGLFVEFTPYDHPDVDSYVLEVSGLGVTRVITTGNSTYYHYNDAGEPVGDPVSYAIFNGLNPETTYTLRLGAQDIDSGQTAWSQEQVVTVPLGDFSLAATQQVFAVPAGQEEATVTLLLTKTADLFSDVSIYLDGNYLPPGVSIHEISYEPLDSAAGRLMAGEDTSQWAHITLALPDDLPSASYLLPFVAYSGKLVKTVSVRLRVGVPQSIVVYPNATQTTYLDANLPLPTCATSLRIGVPPGAFATATRLSFEQSTANVTDWQGRRFARVHFVLNAADASSGAARQPGLPLSAEIEYDPACLVGLYEKGLHLRSWTSVLPDFDRSGWSADGVTCQPHPEQDRVNCDLAGLGDFALFEPVRLLLPVVYAPFLIHP